MYNMEPDILIIAKFATPSLAFIVFTIKVLAPLTKALIVKMNGIDTSADARLCKIENDFTHEVRTDITEIKATIEYLRQGFGALKIKVAVLEEKVK